MLCVGRMERIGRMGRMEGLLQFLQPRNSVSHPELHKTLSQTTPTRSTHRGSGTGPYRVIHDRPQRRFIVRLEEGGVVDSAVLKYSFSSDRHLHLLSTVVPDSFRGKGVASHLAKAALDFVVEERLKATISCWYIQKYVDENPQSGYKAYIKD